MVLARLNVSLLCNALIQSHFDHASSAWYLNLTEKMKNKIQIKQKKRHSVFSAARQNDPYFQKRV